MPLKSVWKIVEFIKVDCEEWGGELQINEASLYRHVEEMLDLEREPPVSAPVGIVERRIAAADWARVDDAEIRIAADWDWTIFHDLFGEYPPTGDEDGYKALVLYVLEVRRPHVVERLPPLS